MCPAVSRAQRYFGVNLARHSANGWEDSALPDDYKDIGELLGMTPENVMDIIGAEGGAVHDIEKPHP